MSPTVQYPVRLARSTLESFRALLKASSENPHDLDLRHALADEIEEMGDEAYNQHIKSYAGQDYQGVWNGRDAYSPVSAKEEADLLRTNKPDPEHTTRSVYEPWSYTAQDARNFAEWDTYFSKGYSIVPAPHPSGRIQGWHLMHHPEEFYEADEPEELPGLDDDNFDDRYNMSRVKYARSSAESLNALFQALIKDPTNADLRHATADELEEAGQPEDAKLLRMSIEDKARAIRDYHERGHWSYLNPDPLSVSDRLHVDTALWASTDRDGNPLDQHSRYDFHPDTLASMLDDWHRFRAQHRRMIEAGRSAEGDPTPEQNAANDFWMSRNGHGAGFFDTPGQYGGNHDRLQAAARQYGEFHLEGPEPQVEPEEFEQHIYQADTWCPECADAIRQRITEEGNAPADPDDERTYDSDDFPKYGGGEMGTYCANGENCPHFDPDAHHGGRNNTITGTSYVNTDNEGPQRMSRIRYAQERRPKMSPEEQESAFLDAIVKDPDNIDLHHAYADLLQEQGRHGEAAFFQAPIMSPQYPDADDPHLGPYHHRTFDYTGMERSQGPASHRFVHGVSPGVEPRIPMLFGFPSPDRKTRHVITKDMTPRDAHNIARLLDEQGFAFPEDNPESVHQKRYREQVRNIAESESPVRHSAYRAPKGGAVVRGTYYQGGKLIPDLEGDFANPPVPEQPMVQYPQPKVSLRDRLKAKFKRTEPLVVSYARDEPVQYAFGQGGSKHLNNAAKGTGNGPYEIFHNWLGKRSNRKSGSNKIIYRDGDDIHVKLHNTNVVTLHKNGDFTLRHGGWNTPTTRGTMQAVIGLPVRSDKGVMKVGSVPVEDGKRYRMDDFMPKAPEVNETRPTEMIPEDYYAMSRKIAPVRYARSTPESLSKLMDAVRRDDLVNPNHDLHAALADELREAGRHKEADLLLTGRFAVDLNGGGKIVKPRRLNTATRRGFAGQAGYAGVSHMDLFQQLRNGRSNRIGNNRTIEAGPDGDVRVLLHGNHVVTAHPDGSYSLFAGQWHTPTTFAVHREITGESPNRVRGRTMFRGQPFEDGVRFTPDQAN